MERPMVVCKLNVRDYGERIAPAGGHCDAVDSLIRVEDVISGRDFWGIELVAERSECARRACSTVLANSVEPAPVEANSHIGSCDEPSGLDIDWPCGLLLSESSSSVRVYTDANSPTFRTDSD